LRVQAEHEYPVPPLAPAEAVRLFYERAAAMRHGFHETDDNAETVARICLRLDGMPLAIELAAAQVRLLPPSALLERLDHRLDALVGGARDLPERQRTLRTTINWSHDLLDADEKRLFAALGVFEGSFSLAAADAVGEGLTTRDVLDVVASLVDKSMLRAEATAGEPRFRMLGMIGEFARERLGDSADAERAGERHAAFYRELSIALGKGVRSADQRRWLDVVGPDGDADNLRAALAWFLHHRRLDEFSDTAWGLWPPAWITGRLAEGREFARQALATSGALSPTSRGRLAALAGLFAVWMGDHDEAVERLGEAIAIGRDEDDDEIVAVATLASSMVASSSDERRAEQLATGCLESFRQLHDRWSEAATLNVLGWLYVGQERFEGTASVFEDTVTTANEVGDDNFAALGEVNLAEYRLHHGDIEGASALLASCAARHREVRLMYSMPYLLDGVARFAFARGDARAAAVLLGAADRRRASTGVSVWGSQLERRERLIGDLRTALGADASAVAFREGAALCYADALAAIADALAVTTEGNVVTDKE
jgi:hypothetical protein